MVPRLVHLADFELSVSTSIELSRERMDCEFFDSFVYATYLSLCFAFV